MRRKHRSYDIPEGSGAAMARELFELVEKHQGYAHISDGMEILSKDQILNVARDCLNHSRMVSKKVAAFLRKHEVKEEK